MSEYFETHNQKRIAAALAISGFLLSAVPAYRRERKMPPAALTPLQQTTAQVQGGCAGGSW